MYSITVDGCDYKVKKTDVSNLNAEIIEVVDADNHLVGESYISHNCESAQVRYSPYCENEDFTASYPYHEYTSNWEGRLKLATWIVSTHPVNG